jgi:hypothetical protein
LLAITNGGRKSRSATVSSTGDRKDDTTNGKNRSINPSSRRTRTTYLDPSMKSTTGFEDNKKSHGGNPVRSRKPNKKHRKDAPRSSPNILEKRKILRRKT